MTPQTARAPATGQASARHCLFETALGVCGVAWNDEGLSRVQLPAADRGATERRLLGGSRDSVASQPPPWVERLIADIARYAGGEPTDFSAVKVDLRRFGPFHHALYAAARTIRWGETRSYGELARAIGEPDARAVGQAMGQNPVPIVIPCHRVLAAKRAIGGFSAPGGAATKRRLLALEGIRLDEDAPRLPGL
jgi:methylated-DNA-[protein]-cysteine S-methyltransferase